MTPSTVRALLKGINEKAEEIDHEGPVWIRVTIAGGVEFEGYQVPHSDHHVLCLDNGLGNVVFVMVEAIVAITPGIKFGPKIQERPTPGGAWQIEVKSWVLAS